MIGEAEISEKDPWSGGFVPVCLQSDIANGQTRRFDVNGHNILVIGSGGRIFALANKCPHMAKPLEGGRVSGMAFQCPFHAAQFDLETGKSMGFPKTKPARTYPVRIERGHVLVLVEGQSA